MKKIVFIGLSLTIMSLAVLPLSAEKGGKKGNDNGKCGYMTGMDKPFMHFNMMQKKLDLTDAQVDKMYKIKKDYVEKFYQNRNNPDKIKELRDKCQAEMSSVLTPAQKAKKESFAKDKAKKDKMHDKKNAKGAKEGGHGYHMGMLQKNLGLSNEQSDKIFKIHKDYMDRFHQNRKDENKLKELHAKQMSEIQSVLTPEQKAKLEEFKKNHKKGDQKKNDKKK